MTKGPKRIRLSRAKGWRIPAGTINVARPSRWGNPFRVGLDGTREECVALYRALLDGDICPRLIATPEQQRAVRDYALGHIDVLRGKNLACWCPLDGPCHADVLLALANRASHRT